MGVDITSSCPRDNSNLALVGAHQPFGQDWSVWLVLKRYGGDAKLVRVHPCYIIPNEQDWFLLSFDILGAVGSRDI